MIESIINPHGFLAIQCDKWKNYKRGKCNSKIAVFMGENVSKKIRGQFYLETNNATPFGKGFYKISNNELLNKNNDIVNVYVEKNYHDLLEPSGKCTFVKNNNFNNSAVFISMN